jgi:hypothetical protein
MKSIKDKIKPPLEVEKGYIHPKVRMIDILKSECLLLDTIPGLPIILQERIENEANKK